MNHDKGYQYEEFVNCGHTNLGMTPYRLSKIIKYSAKAYVIRVATICITYNYTSKTHSDTHMCKHTHTHTHTCQSPG